MEGEIQQAQQQQEPGKESNNNRAEPSGPLDAILPATTMSPIMTLVSTGEGKLLLFFIFIGLLYLAVIWILRYTRFSDNVTYGPVLLDRVYQGYPIRTPAT
tara:strand:+ start:979 stop:1281 length:303 start_codon:yes stop_codon:yes gene_type:complete